MKSISSRPVAHPGTTTAPTQDDAANSTDAPGLWRSSPPSPRVSGSSPRLQVSSASVDAGMFPPSNQAMGASLDKIRQREGGVTSNDVPEMIRLTATSVASGAGTEVNVKFVSLMKSVIDNTTKSIITHTD